MKPSLVELVQSIAQAKRENLSYARWKIRTSVATGKFDNVVEKWYIELLEDCLKLPAPQKVKLWKLVRFPNWRDIIVPLKNIRLAEEIRTLDLDLL